MKAALLQNGSHDKPACRRKGFVLMVVLALIVFGVTLLARLSQQSVGLASQAQRREREMRERWSRWSIASTVLPQAGQILEPIDETARENVTMRQVSLNGRTWQICVNDLDTAVNLNTVGRLGPKSAVRDLLRQTRVASLRPTARLDGPVDSWGQLLIAEDFSPRDLGALQEQCTCWGSGRLNIRFASDRTLTQLGRALGRAGLFARVIRLRSEENIILKGLISEASRSAEDERLLRGTLSEQSRSYSVLVWDTQSPNGVLQCILESGDGTYADRQSTFRYD